MEQDRCVELTNMVSLFDMFLDKKRSKVSFPGDIVKAIVTTGKKRGTYLGRIAVRTTGSFNISTFDGLIQGISHKYCQHIHQKDGYSYVA